MSSTLEGAWNRERRLRNSVHASLKPRTWAGPPSATMVSSSTRAFLHVEKRFRLAESMLDEVAAAVGHLQVAV